MKKDIIITFDYEVFLGNNIGTIQNCVIKPTQYVLEILKVNNAKSIFFVDAPWLLFIKENFPSDFQEVSDQLKDIIKSGSTVELHLHPQWLDAVKIGGQIKFKSFKNYTLHNLKQEQILSLFKRSIDLLEGITLQKINCFRAGGFCIEPFETIKIAFETFKIKHDFSVVPGMSLITGNEYDYDFSETSNLAYYAFQNDVKKSEPNGQFVEIPVSVFSTNPIYRLLNNINLKYNDDKIFGDGKGIQAKSYYFFRSLKRRLSFSKTFLSLDNTSYTFFKYLLNYHFKNDNFLVTISHPKTMSRQALQNLAYIAKNYNTHNSFDLDRSFDGQYANFLSNQLISDKSATMVNSNL